MGRTLLRNQTVEPAMASQTGGVSFDWDREEKEKLDRTIASLKGDGRLPTDANRSDVLRALARDWMQEPDPSVLEAE